MPQDFSFDVVSKVNLQEVSNAVQQASKEIATRFDFRGSISKIEWDEKELTLTLTSEDAGKLKSVVDILETKLFKRGVAVKALDFGNVEPAAGGTAREIVKTIKDRKLKVQAAIQADQVRVSGRNKDDLQTVMATLRAGDFGLPLQFINY